MIFTQWDTRKQWGWMKHHSHNIDYFYKYNVEWKKERKVYIIEVLTDIKYLNKTILCWWKSGCGHS